MWPVAWVALVMIWDDACWFACLCLSPSSGMTGARGSSSHKSWHSWGKNSDWISNFLAFVSRNDTNWKCFWWLVNIDNIMRISSLPLGALGLSTCREVLATGNDWPCLGKGMKNENQRYHTQEWLTVICDFDNAFHTTFRLRSESLLDINSKQSHLTVRVPNGQRHDCFVVVGGCIARKTI